MGAGISLDPLLIESPLYRRSLGVGGSFLNFWLRVFMGVTQRLGCPAGRWPATLGGGTPANPGVGEEGVPAHL